MRGDTSWVQLSSREEAHFALVERKASGQPAHTRGTQANLMDSMGEQGLICWRGRGWLLGRGKAVCEGGAFTKPLSCAGKSGPKPLEEP